jgi:2-succinyl-5-enolpyruvyl-6-hydroxy-3-cyclohexene-1-carboxylate synthase
MREVPQAVIDAEGSWQDPDMTLCRVFALEPAAALAALEPLPANPDWLSLWNRADRRAAEAIQATLTPAASGLSEPVVASELGVLLPENSTLFVASSMPVRDIETFWPVRADPPRVLCNRGANGIDGTVSSAFGAAAAGQGPVVLLIGDVALAHDLGGLLAAERLSLKLTIVLLNNGGGGIFDFLPVAKAPLALQADRYREHIATPTGLDFAKAAALYGLEHEPVSDIPSFRAALEQALSAPRSTLIEVRTERAANVDLHRRAWDAVARALAR